MTESLEAELEHMFREDLIAACQYWDVELSGSSSGTSLTKKLAKNMHDDEIRDRVFATFTKKELDLLGMLTLNGGAMSYDRLKPYRKIYSYGQLNQTERDLRKKGVIIRRMMSRLTELGREVAEFKVIDFFIPQLKSFFKAKPDPDHEKPKGVRKQVNNRDTLLIDMLLLLSYLAKNEVSMTSSWEFPKRESDHVIEAMSEHSEDRFEVVQKMARKLGAYTILEDDRVTPSQVEKLFTGNQSEVVKRLLLASLGRTRAIWATPDQPTEYTLNLVICRLRESTIDQWIHIDDLRDWVRSELFLDKEPLKWIQVDSERVAIALETPILLGLVEAAYKGKRLLAVKLTSVGEEIITRKEVEEITTQETFFVQPNFEITVFTSEMDYYKLYQLMLITEPVKTDVVSTYRITDKSIFLAIEAGLREENILKFLEDESSKPVPMNVVRSIKDWMSQTTFASVSDVHIFETDKEDDLEELLLYDDFQKYVVRKIGPKVVIVSGDMEKMGEDLRKYKVKVKMSGHEEPVKDEQSGRALAEQILLYGEKSISDIPEACIACPALQSCNRVVRRRAQEKEE